MKRLTYVMVAMIAVWFGGISGAFAQTAYVSSNGSGSACSASAPCQLISSALSVLAAGGTIVCLSAPASEYIVIAKSVTIDCVNGPFTTGDLCSSTGGILASMKIDIPSNETLQAVKLRGVTFFGQGPSVCNGLLIIAAKSVTVENSEFKVGPRGIFDRRTAGQTRLYVHDTHMHDLSGAAIVAASASVGITVLDNVRLENNGYGIAIANGNNVVINRSVISGNTTAGVEADPGAQLEVSNSVLSHNNVAVQAFGTVRLRENDIKFSNTAIQGSAVSFGANRFSGNGSVGATPSLVSGAPADLFN